MQINEYNSLLIHQKAKIIGSTSTFICCYSDAHNSASLYAYEGFYIEVLWDSRTDRLIEIVAFNMGGRLDKYLDRIKLSDLI